MTGIVQEKPMPRPAEKGGKKIEKIALLQERKPAFLRFLIESLSALKQGEIPPGMQDLLDKLTERNAKALGRVMGPLVDRLRETMGGMSDEEARQAVARVLGDDERERTEALTDY